MNDGYTKIIRIFDGGEGSGHFNHVGIPNHKGGSARSGQYRNNQNRKFVSGHLKLNGKNRAEKIQYLFPNKTAKEIIRYKNAIENYTGANYEKIKNAYRSNYGNKKLFNNKEIEEKYKQYSNDLDDFIYQSPKYKGTIYRGLDVSTEVSNDIINKLKTGKTMDMQGVASWTSDKSLAQAFSVSTNNDVSIIFNVDNKSGVSVKAVSEIPSENEILSPTTSRYKLKENSLIRKSKDKNGRICYHIDLVEI